MHTVLTFVRCGLRAGVLPVVLAAFAVPALADELRFGNVIERVHPDDVELVQYCRQAGIGYNLNNQTGNPGGGGIVSTDEGRVIVLYLNARHALTVEQLEPLSKATELSSFRCPAWADDETLAFFTHPGRFPKVTGLSIYGPKITDAGLAGLKDFPLLASLNVDSPSLTDKGVLYLSKIPTLSFLRLNATRVTDRGVSYLKDLPRLSFLELKTTQITDAGLEHLSHLPELHMLYLDGTAITGRGLRHLASLTKLRLLSLNNTHLDDRGLAELAEHPNLTKLEVLYLSNTRITDAGCQTFERLNDLKVLDLDKTKITDHGARHIRNMPRLYNLSLSNLVTKAGRKWLAENGQFEAALLSQLRRAAGLDREGAQNRKALQVFQAGLTGTPLLAFQLGQTSSEKAEAARQQLLEMKAAAIPPLMEIAEKCGEAGHPLSKDGDFKFQFRTNAAAVLRAVCREAMPTLADHCAQSAGKRDLISLALQQEGNELIPHLELWLQHDSPQVRLEALHQLARRGKIRPLGPGAASPMTKKHNSLQLSESGRQRVYALLADAEAPLRRSACTVVLAVEDDAAVKAKALVQAALREKDEMTRWTLQETLFFLAEQQPVDGQDLPVLLDGLMTLVRDSTSTSGQHMALGLLGGLGGKSLPALALLRAVRDGPDQQLAARARRALDQIDRCPITLLRATGVPADVQNLVFTLTTHERETINRASAELVRRGPSMIEPLLTAARAEVDEYYPEKAAAVVAQWPQDEVLPRLRPAFHWTGTSVRLLVIHSIKHMKWRELPSVVKDSLESADAQVRAYMRHALPTLAGNTTGPAAQELARLMAAESKNE